MAGDLIEHVRRGRPIGAEKASRMVNVAADTVPEYAFWVDRDDITIVEVHRYKNRDGSIGTTGKNDPKRINFQGDIYGKVSPSEPKPKRLSSRKINQLLNKHGKNAAKTYWLTMQDRILSFWYYLFPIKRTELPKN